MNRRTVAVAVLAVWVGALGWLVRREVGGPDDALLTSAALSLPPGATYYRVSSGGAQLGFASTTIDTLPDTLRVTEVLALEVPVLGTLRRSDMQTEAILSRDLALRSFTAWLRSDDARFAARGGVAGDTLLTIVLETGSTRDTLRLSLERPIVLPSVVALHVAFGGDLEIGRAYTLPVFDPVTFTEREVRLTIEAESTFVFPDSAVFDSSTGRFVPILWDTVQAWAVRYEGGTGFRTWIDRVGQIVHATSPVGFTFERSAFELTYENFRRSADERRAQASRGTAGGVIVHQTAIASNVSLRPARLRELRVRLSGVELAGFDLEGGSQRLAADTLIVTRLPPSALRAEYSLRTPPGRLGAFMQPEPLIQSDDPRIEAQARQIIGRTRDPAEATERLTTWVHEQLAKEVTLSIPNAVDVLERRRGDCNEHTALFVALARAVKIPTRIAAGLVYLDGAFYYHAWPEVWLNEQWVGVDPTFGQVPADASHLRFTIGSLARQLELLRLLGRLSLAVVSQPDGA